MSCRAFLDFDTRKDKTAAQVVQDFNEAASKYEEVMQLSTKYSQPLRLGMAVADFFDEAKRATVKILDVAAGTGLLAKEQQELSQKLASLTIFHLSTDGLSHNGFSSKFRFLPTSLWDKGFRRIDGLDPAEGMRNEAMKREHYTSYYLEYMDEHHIDSILTDTYDCLAAAGGFNVGLIPCAGLLEMIRMVKPGGLICFGLVSIGLKYAEYKNRLRPLMSWLEEDGVWESLESIHFDDLFGTELPGEIKRFIVKASEIDVSIHVNKLKELS